MNDDPNAFTDEELEEMEEEIERDYMDNVLGIASYDEMNSWVELDGVIFDSHSRSELYEYLGQHYNLRTACAILFDECAIRDTEKQLEILAPYYRHRAEYESQVSELSYEPLGAKTWGSLIRSDPYPTQEQALKHARELAKSEIESGACEDYRIYVYTVVDGIDLEVQKWER